MVALAGVLSAAAAGDAAAQAWAERFYVTFSGGIQPTANDFSDRFEFEEYLEQARVDVDYDSASGPFFDGGVGVRLWKNLGAGVAFSFFTKDNPAAIEGAIPHPFFDAQPREISGEASSLSRKDAVVHLQGMAMIDPPGPLRLVLFGGPSFFRVEQDVVSGVRYSEEYPYDTATFTGADVRAVSESAVGFNAGADVVWMLHQNVGVGGLLRFTRASIDLDVPESGTISVDAGGFQAGAGIRLVF
jgi:hypothetical protein